MQWDLAQLSALSAAVSEGTFEAAARALNVTPSAVSQRVKSLESSVGRVLLQRSKPVRPTESGEAVLLLARQIETLSHDALAGLGVDDSLVSHRLATVPDGANGARRAPVRMPIAVNADSLATWLLPALAELSSTMTFDLFREDQAHTTALLRDGTVMAAVTGVAEPVQGCSSVSLGAMRYRPMASRRFAADWFAVGVTAEAFGRAPVVVFDRRDELQDRYLNAKTAGVASPPRHFVPASADFVEAVRLGFGWGMVPDLQSSAIASGGDQGLVELDPAGAIDVPLYWQQWQLHTPSLERVALSVKRAAALALI